MPACKITLAAHLICYLAVNATAGTVTMTCSDGSEHTIDAQPGYDPGWADGTGVARGVQQPLNLLALLGAACLCLAC